MQTKLINYFCILIFQPIFYQLKKVHKIETQNTNRVEIYLKL